MAPVLNSKEISLLFDESSCFVCRLQSPDLHASVDMKRCLVSQCISQVQTWPSSLRSSAESLCLDSPLCKRSWGRCLLVTDFAAPSRVDQLASAVESSLSCLDCDGTRLLI